MSLSDDDRALMAQARLAYDRLYVQGRHEVAAAVRTASGHVFTGIHIEASVGFADVCGEVAALCCMVAAGHRDLDTIVAVWVDTAGVFQVLGPCGRCREVIHDFNPRAWVILGPASEPRKVTIAELLPFKPATTLP